MRAEGVAGSLDRTLIRYRSIRPDDSAAPWQDTNRTLPNRSNRAFGPSPPAQPTPSDTDLALRNCSTTF